MKFDNDWTKLQETWLNGCLKFYSAVLDYSEEFLKLGKEYRNKLEKQMKSSDENKDK